MKTFLIDEELRDKITSLVTHEFCDRLRELPEVISREAIHKVVGDIVDGKEMWSAYDIASAIHALQLPAPASSIPTVDMLTDVVYQDNTALLTNVEALYIARAVHAYLTKGRGGV